MKKLMIATLGLAVAGSVFGTPEVFDYKASVKHMYLKEVKIKTANFSGIVYQKYAKSASLKGYLIMDREGVTSPTITANNLTPSEAGAFDYGRNRGFLVVQNSKAEAKVRAPKILPAVLDAKWVDTQFKKEHKATSGLAEGTLFVGGDSVACVRPQLDVIDGKITERSGAPAAPAANTPGMSAYADYVWTSVYLFGQFNGPNWFKLTGGVSPFNKFESEWDAKLPTDLQLDWQTKEPVNYYHDTWMNGAGIGKFAQPKSGDLCCGLQESSEYVLVSLSGNLKGGLFLCSANGIDTKDTAYSWFDGYAWEDQFNCALLADDPDDPDDSFTFSPDNWQNDMWNDGAVEQETTDVLFGSWSIKRSNKFFPSNGNGFERSLTENEKTEIEPAAGTDSLWAAIKGAALKLKNSVKVYNGEEIYETPSSDRFDIPMVTPQFALYYGLKTR